MCHVMVISLMVLYCVMYTRFIDLLSCRTMHNGRKETKTCVVQLKFSVESRCIVKVIDDDETCLIKIILLYITKKMFVTWSSHVQNLYLCSTLTIAVSTFKMCASFVWNIIMSKQKAAKNSKYRWKYKPLLKS